MLVLGYKQTTLQMYVFNITTAKPLTSPHYNMNLIDQLILKWDLQ